jgi:hypothetical protein
MEYDVDSGSRGQFVQTDQKSMARRHVAGLFVSVEESPCNWS